MSEIKGVRIIKEMIAAYESVRHYRDFTTVHRYMAANDQINFESNFEVYLKRPNYLAILLKSGVIGSSIVCDGETLCIAYPDNTIWACTNAPHVFDAFDSRYTVTQIGFYPPGLFLQMFKWNCYEFFKTNFKTIQYVANEIEYNRELFHLQLSSNDGFVYDLWLHTDTHLIYKIRYRPESQILKHIQSKDLPVSSYVIEEVHTQISIDGTIDNDIFSFTPPPGVEEDRRLKRLISKK